ncbi:Uncharacterised protein, partial [Mycoplasma putrefaciens]
MSSSTVNLGINLLQRNFLKTDKEVDAIRNNGGVRGFVNAIESNQGLISTIANLLISSSNDSDSSFYNGLTVKQLFNKQLNEISKIITKKEHNNHNEDHLPNDLIEYFW